MPDRGWRRFRKGPVGALQALFGARLGGERFVAVGVVGELTHIGTLLALNVVGPRYLGLGDYGDYSRAVGAAVVITGLINTPLSLRLLVASNRKLNRAPLVNMAASGLGAGVVAPIAGLGASGILAAVSVGLGQSLASATAHLGYRKGISTVYAAVATWITVCTLGSIAYAAYSGLGGTTAALIQGATILIGSVGALIATQRLVLAPAERSDHDRSTIILSVPTLLAGVAQWLLVLLIGRMAGSEEAAVVRIGTSLMGIPAALVPLSGALIYSAAASRVDGRWVTAKMVGWCVLAGGLASVPLIFVRGPILEFIGGGRLAELGILFPYLLLAGVGLMGIKLSWVSVVTMFMGRRVRMAVSAALLVLGLATPFGGVAGWRIGLGGLGATYILGFVLIGISIIGGLYRSRRKFGSPDEVALVEGTG